MDLLRMFGGVLNARPYLRLEGLSYLDPADKAEIEAWLNVQFFDEWQRQRNASIGEDIDAGMRDSLMTTDMPNPPEHAPDYLKPPEGEEPESKWQDKPTVREVHEPVVEAKDGDHRLSEYARHRAQRADLWVGRDGTIRDHKPTLLNRLLRRRPVTTVEQSMGGLVKGPR